MRLTNRVALTPEELTRLRGWVDDAGTSPRVRTRARIVLWSAAGHSDAEIASKLGKDVATVSLWRRRFLIHRLAGGLRDSPRPGRKPKHSATRADEILHATFNDPPPQGHRWTTRTMARRLGVNHMLVQRVWQAQGVSPRRAYRIPDRLSGPALPFVDLLGVVLQPPTRVALVGVELNGESRIAHLDPLGDSFRTDLSGGHLLHSARADPAELVALLDGFQSLTPAPAGRRHQLGHLLIVLREVEERTSSTTRVHLLAEGRGAAKDPRLTAWLRQHPRFILHDLGVGPAWSADVGRFFSQWHGVHLRAGSLRGIPTFTRAAAQVAAHLPEGGDGVVWSIAQTPAGPQPARPGEMDVTDSLSARSVLLRQLTHRTFPSEKRPTTEKFSLRTTGP